MKDNTENAIVNAIGELGVKLDQIEKSIEKVDKNTGDLNYKFDRMFELLKENFDLKQRIERLEKEVFKK
jgi:cell division septum initiation protein DivIVA